MKKTLLITLFLGFMGTLMAQNIKLPEPQKNKSTKSLMVLLNERQTSRNFSDKELSKQELSNILWAGFGYNKYGKRTAPSAANKQEIDIYVALKSGLYQYDAKENILIQIRKDDIRAKTGKQDFVKEAPISLIYVADKKRMNPGDEIGTHGTLNIDCGFISQNVYLYCTAMDYATVVRGGGINREELAKEMGLDNTYTIIVCQTIGYKK